MKRLKRPGRSSVKEAVDHLPDALCYFNKNGIPVLCNHTMHSLVSALSGKDLQHISELEALLERLHVFGEQDTVAGPDGTSWSFSVHRLTGESGETYTEYVASDVTELTAKRRALEQGNLRLREAAKQLRLLSANAVALAREEETLSLKMRVHDQMGRCLTATNQLLAQKLPLENAVPILREWREAVSLLNRAGLETEKTDPLAELQKVSGELIKISVTGELPREEEAAYLIVTAIRECAVNALRHAGATELYVSVVQESGRTTARITNNGRLPGGEIVPGGGLTTLRRRLERVGGAMELRAAPSFMLTVTVPGGKERAKW